VKLLLLTWRWLDERLGFSSTIMPIVRHPVPRSVNWWYVTGSATLMAFILQVVTGVALATNYVPAPSGAYDSLHFITSQAEFGNILRGMHFFGASAMVVLVLIHMTQVFMTGSYKYPRELNWLSGVLLLALTLAMAFTGQLLRWDQNAFWSTVVGAEQAARTPVIGGILTKLMIAGKTMGGATLTRFFAIHVFLIPALIFAVVGLHLYLVIRHGVSEWPRAGRPVHKATYLSEYDEELKHGEPFFPDAAWKDVIVMLLVVVAIIALAVIFGPPHLGKPADPTIVQAYPRPDWYFVWYFAVLALSPPSIENLVILGFPLLVFLGLALIPLLWPTGERSLRSRPWAPAVVTVPVILVVVLSVEGFRAPWSPNFAALGASPLPAAVQNQLDPARQKGAQVFQFRGCRACHAIEGAGGHKGPDLGAVGDRLTPAQLTTRIAAGGGGMPAYAGVLSPAEMQVLVDFLQGLRSPNREPAGTPLAP